MNVVQPEFFNFEGPGHRFHKNDSLWESVTWWNWFSGLWGGGRGTELSYQLASLCGLAGRYDNPIPYRFLAPIDKSKIPAQRFFEINLMGHSWLDSILGPNRFQERIFPPMTRPKIPVQRIAKGWSFSILQMVWDGEHFSKKGKISMHCTCTGVSRTLKLAMLNTYINKTVIVDKVHYSWGWAEVFIHGRYCLNSDV